MPNHNSITSTAPATESYKVSYNQGFGMGGSGDGGVIYA